jgi:hypothetical protein
MKNVLLLLFLFTAWAGVHAQISYEDFEDGQADISWIGLNGVYNGIVTNPAPDAVNGSEFVGSNTNV